MTLNPTQKETLRATLRKRRAALLAELADDAARVRAQPFAALVGETPDAGEAALADTIADTGQAELTRDLRDLRAVESALQRFETGRYGYCKECGVEIAPARLQANPAAARCGTCQERHESFHRRAASL